MAVQTREQGRYLGGRPPYGYRLADAGPHPNKAHAAWGRRAHRLEPDPATVPVAGWTLGTVTTILENPRYTGRQVWNRQRTDTELADPANVTLGHKYLLAGLLACGLCGRRMESAWSNGKPAYRCRHGRTSAMVPDPARPKNTYIREDKLLPHLPALHLLLTSPAVRARRRTRAGADVKSTISPGEVIGYLREHEITLTWNPAAAALQTHATQTAKTVTVTAR